jgi:CDGSH-type Zn-finger protein
MLEIDKKITVRPNGPYLLRGGIPLVRKSQVMSEHGEPLSWKEDGKINTESAYRLCRCGQSKSKPFCDGSHTMVDFDGKESADTGPISARSKTFRSPKIFIQEDYSICVHSGFCRDRLSDIWKMRRDSNDAQVLARIIDKLDNCPSGALAYSLGGDGEVIEPELAKEVVVIPDGPLWVTGRVSVERSDGQPIESRNRVTLCRCGASAIKPLCDGTHKEIVFSDA